MTNTTEKTANIITTEDENIKSSEEVQWHLLIDEGCRKCFCVIFDKSNKNRRPVAKGKG